MLRFQKLTAQVKDNREMTQQDIKQSEKKVLGTLVIIKKINEE